MMRLVIFLFLLLMMVAGCTSDDGANGATTMEPSIIYDVTVFGATQRAMVTFDIPMTDDEYDTEAALRLMSEAACAVREANPGYMVRFGGNMQNGLTGITATLAPDVDCAGLRWKDFSEYSIAEGLR